MQVIRRFARIKYQVVHLAGTFCVLALGLLASNSAGATQAELSEHHGSESAIEGSWILSIDRINQGGSTFTALMSFTSGGVALATGSGDRLPPPPISPLYGSWKSTGPNRAVVTLNFFIFDSLGNPVAMLKNHISIHLKGPNHLEGTGVALSCSVEGENCVSAVGFEIAIAGARIIPEGPAE